MTDHELQESLERITNAAEEVKRATRKAVWCLLVVVFCLVCNIILFCLRK